MTTTKIEVVLGMKCDEDITIDWGDGFAELVGRDELNIIYRHTYTEGVASHRIVLRGKNRALTYLSCQGNNLTALDVSKNITLMDLSCHNNNLTVLDMSKNVALRYLYCEDNPFLSDPNEFMAMANTLVDRAGIEAGIIYVTKEVVAEPIRDICATKNWNITVSL